MKKSLILLLSIMMAAISVEAQNTEPLLMQKESITDKIEKCRNLTFDKAINESDTASVRELLEYAQTQLEGNNRIAFSIDEYRLLYLMTGQYKVFLKSITSVDDSTYYSKISEFKIPNSINASDYRLGWSLLISNIDVTEDKILQNKELTDEEKDFILLYIKDSIVNRKESNKIANSFLSNNPGSIYEHYTRKYLRHEYDDYAKFGFEMAFQMGSRIYTGGMTDIDNSLFEFGGNFKLLYRRFALTFDCALGFGKLIEDVVADGLLLPCDTKICNTNVGFSLGYKIPVIDDNWYILPAAGIQTVEFADNLPEDESPNISCNGEWKPSLSFEIGRDCLKNLALRRNKKITSTFYTLGIRYAFRPTEIHLQSGVYNGYSHSIGISFGLGMSRAKRVY